MPIINRYSSHHNASAIGVILKILLFISSLVPGAVLMAAQQQDNFVAQLNQLMEFDFDVKEQAINKLAKSDNERIDAVFRTLLNGDLYYRKNDKTIVYIKKTDDGYALTSVLGNESLGVVSKRKIKKITVNNKLRQLLSGLLAQRGMSHDDPAVRLASVKEMIGQLNQSDRDKLEKLLAKEQNNDVIKVLNIAMAMIDVGHTDKQEQLAAIEVLGESDYPESRNRLNQVLNQASEAGDTPVVKQAGASLQQIQMRAERYQTIETVFFGVSLGSVLLLAAIGLAITFGVMGVINMAHGELMMIGAYTTYVVQLLMPNYIEWSLLVAIPAAFVVAGLFGVAIERGVIRFLYGRPLETLLATFGISLVLQQLVRSIFSPLNRSVITPDWMSDSWEINALLSLTYNRLYIIVFSLLVFGALLMVLKKTPLGLHVRAVSQNRTMARAMGIRTEWVDAMTFGLGSGIAGVAGVALSQLTNVGPNLGQAYIIDSFMVVVFGGVGNLWGTLVGAMSLGIANKFMEPWVGAVLAKIFILVFIILFIQKRPRGLFPQKGRAAEN